MKRLNVFIFALAVCGIARAETDMFAFVSDPSTLNAKDTIILAAKGDDWTVVAGPRDNKKLTPLTDNVTVTDTEAGAEKALRLVVAKETGGITLTPVGASKPLAETGGNDFAEANTKNNRYWEFVQDGNKGVYVHNVGNTDAYIKYHISNNIIRPYKLGTVGAVYMYVYVRPYKAPEAVHPASVSLSATSLELEEGETATLTATVKPDNAANKKVTWSSSDAAVATVSNSGVVKAIAEGTATITVTTDDGGLTAECEVTVTAKPQQTEAPEFSVPEGEVERGTEVRVFGNSTDKIYARLNGGDWQSGMAELHFTIEADCTIEAYAVAEGKTESEHVSATYSVKVEDAVETVSGTGNAARKVLRDSQIVILLPDGSVFGLTGSRVE